jgi:hypothetical protein
MAFAVTPICVWVIAKTEPEGVRQTKGVDSNGRPICAIQQRASATDTSEYPEAETGGGERGRRPVGAHRPKGQLAGALDCGIEVKTEASFQSN